MRALLIGTEKVEVASTTSALIVYPPHAVPLDVETVSAVHVTGIAKLP